MSRERWGKFHAKAQKRKGKKAFALLRLCVKKF
jgi:hypothetical protein